MIKHLVLIILLIFDYSVYANDGSFFAKGNQLIPIIETEISVKKEILSLKKIGNKILEVNLYYEFFNPNEDKKIIVGFEAFSPSGDAIVTPRDGHHPYIRDFTVELNNQILNYSVAYVSDSLYVKNGKVVSQGIPKIEDDSEYDADFYYVYHFEAKFKKGINILKHTYNFDLSNSIFSNYDFEYVLTAAKRWSNKQIDEFTLIIDIGEFETFYIDKNFFSSENDWLINGIGNVQVINKNQEIDLETDALKFNIQKGILIFQKQNFDPIGDLFLYSKNNYEIDSFEYIPFSYHQVERIKEPINDFQRKVLKNLPFARRGYIFKDKEILNFYKKFDWYIQNPNYEPYLEMLTEDEKLWIEKFK